MKGAAELCQPGLAVPVTVEAQARIGADAAIIFADILLILQGLGMELRFVAGDGPRLTPPLRRPEDVERLGDPQAAAAARSCRPQCR